MCLFLNISVINHDKIFCHKKFKGACSSVEILKVYMVRERLEQLL